MKYSEPGVWLIRKVRSKKKSGQSRDNIKRKSVFKIGMQYEVPKSSFSRTVSSWLYTLWIGQEDMSGQKDRSGGKIRWLPLAGRVFRLGK